MKQAYPTFIVKSEKYHVVYVPDLDIYTQGTDHLDAIEMARDAIGLKVIVMQDEGIEVPAPSSYEMAIRKAQEDTEDIDFTSGILTLVDIDLTAYRRLMDNKAVRRNVTLPAWLNEEAEKSKVNVSGVLQEALIQLLGVSRPQR